MNLTLPQILKCSLCGEEEATQTRPVRGSAGGPDLQGPSPSPGPLLQPWEGAGGLQATAGPQQLRPRPGLASGVAGTVMGAVPSLWEATPSSGKASELKDSSQRCPMGAVGPTQVASAAGWQHARV